MELFKCRKGTSKNVGTTLREELYFTREGEEYSLYLYNSIEGNLLFNKQTDIILKYVIDETKPPKAIVTLTNGVKKEYDVKVIVRKDDIELKARYKGGALDVSVSLRPDMIFIDESFMVYDKCRRLIDYSRENNINYEIINIRGEKAV